MTAPAGAQDAPDLNDLASTPCPPGSAHDSGDGYCVLDCPVAPPAPIVVREWFTDGSYVDTPAACPSQAQGDRHRYYHRRHFHRRHFHFHRH